MNDIDGGVCDYCNADEGRCWDDCPTVKIRQQSDLIERLQKERNDYKAVLERIAPHDIQGWVHQALSRHSKETT